MNYLEKSYIEEALNYYKIENREEIFKIYERVIENFNDKEKVVELHDILFIKESDDYKSIKEFDKDNTNSPNLNKLIILTGYEIHKRNMLRLEFDNEQIKKQIEWVNLYLNKSITTFHNLQWIARYIRGFMISGNTFEYEIINNTPDYLEKYSDIFLIKIHIPRCSDLSEKNIGNMLVESRKYILKYLNTNKEILFFTESWLLSKNLLNILDEESNIINFQKHFDIIKYIDGKSDFIKFVLNNSNKGDTILKRKIRKYIDEGETLYKGIGILKY